MSETELKESLAIQVENLNLTDSKEDEEDRTIEILQHLENFFSTPQFTGSLQEFVENNMEKFVFAAPGEEQPLRYVPECR